MRRCGPPFPDAGPPWVGICRPPDLSACRMSARGRGISLAWAWAGCPCAALNRLRRSPRGSSELSRLRVAELLLSAGRGMARCCATATSTKAALVKGRASPRQGWYRPPANAFSMQ
eukprot:11239100-Heterocapsa_arctica.AAC.1